MAGYLGGRGNAMKIASAFGRSKTGRGKFATRTSGCGEPQLAEFRRALVGRPHEALVVGAFAVLVGISFVYMTRRERLIASDNAYTANAAAAMVALKGEAYGRLDSLATSAGEAASAVQARLSAAFGITGAPPVRVAAAAPVMKAAAGERHLVRRGRFARAGRRRTAGAASHEMSAAGAVALLKRRSAALPEALYQGSTTERISNWVLHEFPDRVNDECSKAYYGLLNFVASGIDLNGSLDLRTEAENWVDWFTDLLGLPSSGGGFDLSNPGEIFENWPGAYTIIVGAVGALLVMLFFGFLLSTRDALRDAARRARRRRVSETA
jgi:hypothetical protein